MIYKYKQKISNLYPLLKRIGYFKPWLIQSIKYTHICVCICEQNIEHKGHCAGYRMRAYLVPYKTESDVFPNLARFKIRIFHSLVDYTLGDVASAFRIKSHFRKSSKVAWVIECRAFERLHVMGMYNNRFGIVYG